MKSKLSIVFMFLGLFLGQAQVGIGTTTPDLTSMLEIKSDTAGVLIPRMTLTLRDAITTPADGLQIYNTTNNTLDIYSNSSWKSFAYSPDSNLVYVYSLSDLPAPESSGITLDETKMYVFSGAVDISPNYINMNGAGLRGTDPQKDMVISAVSGAVLRSINKSVYIKELAVVPASSGTQAYNFTDDGTHFCNIFSGSSVVDPTNPTAISSLGVGTISGFKAITIIQNYWNTASGVKIGGPVGKFTSGYNFIVDITSGAGIELVSGTIEDVDVANNYFIYSGQTGFKVSSATVERGRLTTNMFRGVGTPIDGITSSELGWSMLQNTDIRDSKAIGSLFFNEDPGTTLTFNDTSTFEKIALTTSSSAQQKFTAENARLTYLDRRPIAAEISASINAEAPDGGSFTIAVFKNGNKNPTTSYPINTLSNLANNSKFQLSLTTEIDLGTDDYIEIFIRSNVVNNQGTPKKVIIDGIQFTASN